MNFENFHFPKHHENSGFLILKIQYLHFWDVDQNDRSIIEFLFLDIN